MGIEKHIKVVSRPVLIDSHPDNSPVLILGQLAHLRKLNYEQVQPKFSDAVSKESWTVGLSKLVMTSSIDSVPLYYNLCTVGALPYKVSRHNTPTRATAITRLVKNHATGKRQFIVAVVERQNAYASVCAIARAFPLFNKKTSVFVNEDENAVTIEFILVGENTEPFSSDEIGVFNAAIEAVRLSARIVDTPCNEMNTEDFAFEIEEVGKKLNIQPVIIKGEDLEKQGFGGIYGVGKAADVPPILAILSHKPEGATQNIAWVGKGIVYDTGGLSMKTKTSMPGMKRDCGGAAGILGAFYLAVKSGFKENLHAVFCLAENAVGPNATKPDDIHTLYSGRTVEINNTDAEGRLVLADGVVYAQKDLKCTTIVDMATLTGAQSSATGKLHAGIVTNNPDMEDSTFSSGLASGDLTFPLPFAPELFFMEFSSSVADMKNSAADRTNAASSCAGLFILSHLGFDYPGVWLHIDMAAPVCMGERATGYGAALLPVLFGQYSESSLLRSFNISVPKDNQKKTEANNGVK